MESTETEELGRAIGEVADLVMLWRKETRRELAILLGMSKRSVERRITGEIPWEAWELKKMADHYNVPVEKFYGGPDAAMEYGLAARVDAVPGTTLRYDGENADNDVPFSTERSTAA